MRDFRIIEHTADVGIRAWGASLEETFEAATQGLATILGGWRPGPGDEHPVTIEPGDLGAQLVDWLSEVIYLQESLDSVVAGAHVERVSDEGTTGSVTLMPRGREVLEGTAVKAITYHQLRVEPTHEGWVAEVYVDV
ncbi:MAG TPA: archease [Actinomycetota bacterium]|jgi:SHS2 domain-containing protein